ncbi:MAG: 4Fe-4S binding protein [Deltaproteobacteria bacterium]
MKKRSTVRLSQLLFLFLFLLLFIKTEYRGSDQISVAVNGFFRCNPLVLAGYLFAAKQFTLLLLPGLIMLLFTMVLGRFFCGWICPLGTLLDLLTSRIRKTTPLRFLQGDLKYWLLIPLLSAALFNINLVGLLDPIAILIRALTLSLYPLLGDTISRGWVGLYRVTGDNRDYLAPAYSLFHDHILPFRETLYPLGSISLLLLLLIFFLERYEKRNWCRNLCPLGTLLSLAGRFSLFRRHPLQLCIECRACRETCPSLSSHGIVREGACMRCMECIRNCSLKGSGFYFGMPKLDRPYLPERRLLLGGILSGFFLARLFHFSSPERKTRLLRPPGVRNEGEFLKKCVRCGECMKVCLKSALYPAVLQGGLEGLFTPMLIPRLGYCEYDCTLCGQVCPTAAIPNLPKELKKKEVIGKAVFDKNHCIPFAKRIDCIVCEEHCPIPQKAIRSEIVKVADFNGRITEVKMPYLVDNLCNGCGICENVCPLEGKSGIEVFAVKEKTPLKDEAGTTSPGEADPYR